MRYLPVFVITECRTCIFFGQYNNEHTINVLENGFKYIYLKIHVYKQ